MVVSNIHYFLFKNQKRKKKLKTTAARKLTKSVVVQKHESKEKTRNIS